MRPKVAIVVAKFNIDITKNLVAGATLAWQENQQHNGILNTYWVPGAVELPLVTKKLLPSYDAIICLGCVIQGETRHFDYVCSIASRGCLQVSLELEKPVIFGVLTTNNRAEAIARSGGNKGNKGYDAMLSALEMIDTINAINKQED